MKIYLAIGSKVTQEHREAPYIFFGVNPDLDNVTHRWPLKLSPHVDCNPACAARTSSVRRDISAITGYVRVKLGIKVGDENTVSLAVLDENRAIQNVLTYFNLSPEKTDVQAQVQIGLLDKTKIVFNEFRWIGFSFTRQTNFGKLLHDEVMTVSADTAWKLIAAKPDDICITVILQCADFYDCSCNILRELNRKLLEEPLNPDCELETLDSGIIKCHRNFLILNSPVFQAALEGDFKEKSNGLIKVEYSRAAVKAMVEYFYFQDLVSADASDAVAIELLEAAHYYHVKRLWKALLVLLESKPLDWYSPVQASKLLEFLCTVDEEEVRSLAQKTVRFLAVMPASDPKDEKILETMTKNKRFSSQCFQHSLQVLQDNGMDNPSY